MIPFGSEYSFLIKNLNTTRALINIFIDGDNIVEGGLVLNAGQEVDLERAIRNNNLTEGNRFKFIERTGAVEAHRGIKLEDGLVRIEFQFEVPRPVVNLNDTLFKQYPPGVRGMDQWGGKYSTTQAYGSTTNINTSYNVGGTLRGIDSSLNGGAVFASGAKAVDNYCAAQGITSTCEAHDGSATMDWNDVGITVPGSKSTQKFATTTMGQLEAEKHTIVLKLLGELSDGARILSPVTVHHKPECITCGKKNKVNAKFCSECGTALEIFA
jgi:hypothetical protein